MQAVPKIDERPAVRILDDIVVNQIAAGEVVERPASVVKELVENAIDAGASEISVSIANGGRSLIEIRDNGCGMTRHDALLAIERYGTSKIERAEDLTSIATLGFRGEALPSIAAVSKFELQTRVSVGSAPGVIININGGKLRDVKDVDIAPGTTISVKNLFYNVPARRRFLRSERTEAGQIKAILLDFALAFPKLRISLIADGKELLSLAPAADFAARAREKRVAGDKPIVVSARNDTLEGPILVEALLSSPLAAVSSAGRLRIIANGRAVRDKLILRAVREGYGNFLKPGKYPTGVLKLNLPPEEIDVNVHPAKAEVRFRAPDRVFLAITRGIRRALSGVKPEREAGDYASANFIRPLRPLSREEIGVEWSASARPNESALAFKFERGSSQAAFLPLAGSAENSPEKTLLTAMRYVGQIFRCYLLFEGTSSEQFGIVDMHAAHERVMFYKIKKQLSEGSIPAQQLLAPELVELPPELVEKFELAREWLKRLGIIADSFGENTVAIRTVPALLAGVSPRALLEDLFSLPEWSDWNDVLERRGDEIVARMACHGSIRSGRELEKEEAYELVRVLEEVQSSAFCPHGRPVAKFISRYELEEMFGRIQ